ncbi:MAG: hypothetical protein OXP68_13370 [Anaerolineaceae bacterium]|nr:hypothetical protein [Anaerolineaceae bacterium]
MKIIAIYLPERDCQPLRAIGGRGIGNIQGRLEKGGKFESRRPFAAIDPASFVDCYSVAPAGLVNELGGETEVEIQWFECLQNNVYPTGLSRSNGMGIPTAQGNGAPSNVGVDPVSEGPPEKTGFGEHPVFPDWRDQQQDDKNYIGQTQTHQEPGPLNPRAWQVCRGVTRNARKRNSHAKQFKGLFKRPNMGVPQDSGFVNAKTKAPEPRSHRQEQQTETSDNIPAVAQDQSQRRRNQNAPNDSTTRVSGTM